MSNKIKEVEEALKSVTKLFKEYEKELLEEIDRLKRELEKVNRENTDTKRDSLEEALLEIIDAAEDISDVIEEVSVVAQEAVKVYDLEHFAWMHDMTGAGIDIMEDAIALNDKMLFINEIFDEDTDKYLKTLDILNNMPDINSAYGYLQENFSEWDFESETVYRFMMTLRRRFK